MYFVYIKSIHIYIEKTTKYQNNNSTCSINQIVSNFTSHINCMVLLYWVSILLVRENQPLIANFKSIICLIEYLTNFMTIKLLIN